VPSQGPGFGVFTTDNDLVVRTWDAFLADITGVTPDQALHRPIADVLPELEPRGLLRVFRNVVANGTVEVLAPALHQYLIACPPSDGSTLADRMQQRVTIGPLRVDGAIVGVAVTIEDVTARVERERELVHLTRALGDQDRRTRRAAVRSLAERGPAIVDALVRTLREQHRDFNVLSSLLELLATAEIDVVQPLIACLRNADVDLRIQAALILGERRDLRAVPPLIDALDDDDVNVRFHAIEALGALRATQAAPRLAGIAGSGDFFLAFPAIHALSRLGDSSVAPALVPLLADEMLRAVATEALGELGDELVVVPLVNLLNRPDAPTEAVADALTGLAERYEVRYGAGEQIADIVRRTIGPVGAQNLLDAVQRVGPDRLRGIAHVMGWLSGAAVERALTRLLGQPSVRGQVVEALVRYGSGVVDLLIAQLSAEDLDTRQAAVVALGRIGDRRATPALINALGEPELAIHAAGALARLGDRSAFEPLLELLGHADAAVRTAAIGALNSIGHPDMAQRVAPLLDDANPAIRESAVKIAGYFGYESCISGILVCCADPTEAIRRTAIEHLPLFEHAGVKPALVHALQADTPAVRAAAAGALGRLDAPEVTTPLRQALRDSDPWVRFFALRSIARHKDPSVAPAVLDLLTHDPAGQVRLAAIEVFGELDTPDAVDTLAPLASAHEPDIARAAIHALGKTRAAGAAAILERGLRAAESWRRAAAIDSLARRGDAAAVPPLQWVVAADTHREVVSAAVSALASLAAREGPEALAATAALISLTTERLPRESLIAALAGLPARRIGDVAKGLRHPSAEIRRATVEALSRMKNPDASRWVERALDDADPIVRAVAVAELRRLGSRHAARKLLAIARTDSDPDVRRAAVMAVTQQRGDEPPASPLEGR
jgi:HEAT repeat protein